MREVTVMIATTAKFKSTDGSSITVRPSISAAPSGRSIFKKASGSPTAGIKSGRKGFNFVSISKICGRYLIEKLLLVFVVFSFNAYGLFSVLEQKRQTTEIQKQKRVVANF